MGGLYDRLAGMKWKTLETKTLFESSFFKFRVDKCELPDGRVMPRYYTMEFSDWANIVPITENNEIVLVEQYRHSAKRVCLEIPGGALDLNKNEDPKQAAVRELLEETGYMPSDVRLLAKHLPNPALQNNWMYTYIALGCKKIQEPDLDPFEDIRVVTKSVPETLELLKKGDINHSIVIASLFHALPYLGIR